MELVIGLMAGIAFWSAAGKVWPRRERVVAARVMGLRIPVKRGERIRARRLRPLEALGRMLPADRSKLTSTLEAAGIQFSADRFLGARFVLATVGGIFGLAFAPFAPLSAAGLAFAGYRTPAVLIRLRAGNRRDEISAAIPDVVDLLAVCAQSGMNLPLALARVAERTQGDLGEELTRTVQQIELGVPRAQALQELADRNEVADLKALTATLVNAERFGSRVASTLATFSSDIRSKRRRRAEEEARRAPVKILFPLVFLILPGFILITLVPLLLGAFATLGF